LNLRPQIPLEYACSVEAQGRIELPEAQHLILEHCPFCNDRLQAFYRLPRLWRSTGHLPYPKHLQRVFDEARSGFRADRVIEHGKSLKTHALMVPDWDCLDI